MWSHAGDEGARRAVVPGYHPKMLERYLAYLRRQTPVTQAVAEEAEVARIAPRGTAEAGYIR